MTDFGDVGRFHYKFGLRANQFDGWGPLPFDSEMIEFRIKFMGEELIEFIEGAGYRIELGPDNHPKLVRSEGVEPDHAQMFDALIDLVYVALGTAHLQGYPWQKGWDLVQTANMAKVRAAKDGSNSKRGSSLDVVKPEGWTAPDIEGLLRSYGWYQPTLDEG